jgi:YteA family regulatory protein
MNHLSPEQLSKLRASLEEMKKDIENRIEENDHYDLDNSMRYSSGELTEIDNHPGDAGTDLYHRSMDISLLERDEHELDNIKSALASMDNGTYGICVASGQPIPYERLVAVPYTRYSKEHNPRQDEPFKRPAEEEYLMPPFGRSSLDERDDYNGFDGEDAWQIVDSWGNSNSPAMSEGINIDSYNEMEIESGEPLGWVEPFENFVATDITGTHVSIVPGPSYKHYLDSEEGSFMLDPTAIKQQD